MKNIVITGAAGFIGFHLVKFYEKKNVRLFLFDNFFKKKSKDNFFKSLRKSNIKFFNTDLTKSINKKKLPKKIDILYHLAAINGTKLFYDMSYELCKNNILSSINIFDLSSKIKIKKIVFSSSSEVYADTIKFGLLKLPTNEENPIAFSVPISSRYSYAISKFVGEFLLNEISKKSKIPVSIIRYHNIYGPRMGYNHVVPALIKKISNNKKTILLPGYNETRSFCYINDAVLATHKIALSKKTNNKIIHVGNQREEIKIIELVKKIMILMESKKKILKKSSLESSVKRRLPDVTKMKKLINYECKTPLRDGLVKTIDWYSKFK